jgi:hypothetical protein
MEALNQIPPKYSPKSLPEQEPFNAIPRGRVQVYGPLVGPASIVTRTEELQAAEGAEFFIAVDSDGFLTPLSRPDFEARYELLEDRAQDDDVAELGPHPED